MTRTRLLLMISELCGALEGAIATMTETDPWFHVPAELIEQEAEAARMHTTLRKGWRCLPPGLRVPNKDSA